MSSQSLLLAEQPQLSSQQTLMVFMASCRSTPVDPKSFFEMRTPEMDAVRVCIWGITRTGWKGKSPDHSSVNAAAQNSVGFLGRLLVSSSSCMRTFKCSPTGLPSMNFFPSLCSVWDCPDPDADPCTWPCWTSWGSLWPCIVGLGCPRRERKQVLVRYGCDGKMCSLEYCVPKNLLVPCQNLFRY